MAAVLRPGDAARGSIGTAMVICRDTYRPDNAVARTACLSALSWQALSA